MLVYQVILDNGERDVPTSPVCVAPTANCAAVILEAMNAWPSNEEVAFSASWALAHIMHVFDEPVSEVKSLCDPTLFPP